MRALNALLNIPTCDQRITGFNVVLLNLSFNPTSYQKSRQGCEVETHLRVNWFLISCHGDLCTLLQVL